MVKEAEWKKSKERKLARLKMLLDHDRETARRREAIGNGWQPVFVDEIGQKRPRRKRRYPEAFIFIAIMVFVIITRCLDKGEATSSHREHARQMAGATNKS